MSKKFKNPDKVITDPVLPYNVPYAWKWYYKAIISSNKAWASYYKAITEYNRANKKF